MVFKNDTSERTLIIDCTNNLKYGRVFMDGQEIEGVNLEVAPGTQAFVKFEFFKHELSSVIFRGAVKMGIR